MPERLHLPCIYARKRRRTRASLESSTEAGAVVADLPAPVAVAEILPSSPVRARRSAASSSQPATLPAAPTAAAPSAPSPAPIGAHVSAPVPASVAVAAPVPVPVPSSSNAASRSPPRFLLPAYAPTPAVSSTSDERSPASRPEGIHNSTVGFLNPDIEPSRPSTPEVDAGLMPSGVYADDDPISMELLSSIEAQHLWLQYMRHLNPLIGLLDPQLHSVEYMRTTSSTLLSAVLMCAAQFFRRPLYAPLLAHTRTLTNRATSTGDKCDLGMVQALALMVSWKEPTDGTSGVKMAIAVRLGYQLGLHVRRTTPLPEDEEKARRVADRERTWFVLSCFDRINSDVFGLPPMIPLSELPECESWAEETDRFHGGDMRHACSLSSASIYLSLIRLRRTYTSMPAEMAYALLNDIYAQMELHLRHWFPDDQSKGKFSAFEQTVLKWFDISHLMRTKFLMLDVCPPSLRGHITTDWLHLAERFTEQTEKIAQLGCLGYMQDTSITHLSMFGVVGHKMAARLPPLQRELVVGYIKRMSACCDASRRDDPHSHVVMDLVARFLSRLLRFLAKEGSGVEEEVVPQDPVGAFDLDEFLRQTFPLPTNTDFEAASLDDQFWSMLFPNPGITL